MPRSRPPAEPPSTSPPAPTPHPAPSPPPAVPPTEVVPVDGTPPQVGAGEAVAVLNALYTAGALKTALAMAEYVLYRVVGCDLARLAAGERDPALARLVAHPDRDFPDFALWTAIDVYLQYLELPAAARDRLSLAHHRLLLAVPDPKGKAQLAQQAVRSHQSREDLADSIRRWRARHGLPPVGHPPEHPTTAAVRKAANAIQRAIAVTREPGTPRPDDELDHQLGLLTRRTRTLLAELAKKGWWQPPSQERR